MAYTTFSNPSSGTFAGLWNTLKLCNVRECVFCHLICPKQGPKMEAVVNLGLFCRKQALISCQ